MNINEKCLFCNEKVENYIRLFCDCDVACLYLDQMLDIVKY